MFPGMDPRMMKQAMKQLGIKQEEINAIEVVIRCADKEIVVSEPSVQKINMQGQTSFQVSGEISERAPTGSIGSSMPEITEEDLETLMSQTGCSKEEAQRALEDSEGDLAGAILALTEQ